MFPTRRITTGGGDVFRDEFSLAFDGSNDNIRISDVTVDTDGACAIVFWAKYAGGGSSPWCVLGNTSDANSKHLRFVGTDDLKWENDTTDEEAVINLPIAFTDQQWHHYVVVSNSGTVTAYQDGVACTIAGDNLSSSNCTFNSIGGQGTNGVVYEYKGNISEIAIYNKALSASEVKTLYNGREPYNHKEGVCSSNLQAWWRMGDGSANNRRFQYIENSASSAGSNIIMSSTFDSDEDGWEDYASGTVARSTDISSHSGSAGVLKCTTDATNNWLGKTTNITSGMESGKIYLVEAYVYIPSSWSGTSDMYIYTADQFGDANTNIGINSYNEAQDTIKDAWQRVFYTFLCQEDSGSGAIYLRTAGTSGLENGDFVYLDDFKITEIDKLSSGVLLNMAPEDFEGDSF